MDDRMKTYPLLRHSDTHDRLSDRMVEDTRAVSNHSITLHGLASMTSSTTKIHERLCISRPRDTGNVSVK